MNTNEYDRESTREPKGAEPGAKPKEAEPSCTGEPSAMVDLLREIILLSESGQNESRLRQLILALEGERLRQIDKDLAMLNEHDLSMRFELKENCAEVIRPLKAALSRTDLTIPEIIFLANFSGRQIRQEQKNLFAEKERIEQKRRPGTRRRRGTT